MKKYSVMTRPEKRVAVAKDVIKQLSIKKYKALTGTYVRLTIPNSVKPDSDIKRNFGKIKKCTVCAMGACLLSITRFENQLKFNEVGTRLYSIANNNAKKLFRLFSPRQLMLIEQSFEGYSFTADRVADRLFDADFLSDKEESINEFFNAHKTDRGRMIAIMENIIQNKGTFIP